VRTAVLAACISTLAVAAGAQASTPKANLKVTYWPYGRAQAATVWTLRCNPAGGTHPARTASCAALAKHAADLNPATRACTLMPTTTSAQAHIVGTWAGRHVDRTYRIGCPGWTDLRLVLTGRT
jgi:Subtilisin inhibitor-like